MEYKENTLDYNDYCKLRESVGWMNFSKTQAEKAIDHSLYTVIATEHDQTIGMGRLIGDGIYYIIVDVAVAPHHQKQGIGSTIVNKLIEYVEKETPIGGRSSIQLIADKQKEPFYERLGFKVIPHDFCGSGMRKVIHR